MTGQIANTDIATDVINDLGVIINFVFGISLSLWQRISTRASWKFSVENPLENSTVSSKVNKPFILNFQGMIITSEAISLLAICHVIS